MRYIIDRLEEGLAVCENEQKKIITIPRTMLPNEVKEGDILKEEKGSFTLDPESRKKRRKAIRKKLEDLFE